MFVEDDLLVLACPGLSWLGPWESHMLGLSGLSN